VGAPASQTATADSAWALVATAGFSVTPTSAAVAENGTTATFTVVLTQQPGADVVFTVSSSDATEATVSPTTLTFTSVNWSAPQTVTITGVNDALQDGSQTSTVTVSVNAALSDNAFDALAAKTVSVTTADNDTFLSGQWQDAAQTAANTDDDDLCWAAAASNLLAWGGWGTATYATAESIFAKFQYHWTDYVGKMYDGWKWWVDGTAPSSRTIGAKVDVGGWTGAYVGQYSADVYVKSMVGAETLLKATLNTAFTNLFGVTLGLLKGADSHAVTVWGYETSSSGQLLGLHLTDSEDNQNALVYAPVQYNAGLSYWDLMGGYSGWSIRELDAFGKRADGKTNSVFGGAGTITGVNYAGTDAPSEVPEPASVILLLLGVIGLLAARRVRRRASLAFCRDESRMAP